MSNIFQLQEELLYLFDQIEENEGEITPEIEEQLAITEEEFKDKIKNYTNVIKHFKSQIDDIKEEQARLKALADKKSKLIANLSAILVKAIDKFGNTKKTGVKYIDYDTGEVSVRKSQSVEVDEDLLKNVGTGITDALIYDKNCNMLDVNDRVDAVVLSEYFKRKEIFVNPEELREMKLSLELSIPYKDLESGIGYTALKEIVRYSDNFKLTNNISKTELKDKLKENGSCVPHLAKLSDNKSLTIK